MKTVLIVDDEPVTRLDLHQMLSAAGYQVVGEAADGFDGVELARAKRPDLVLMDVQMGAFDGLTAAESICREQLAGCVMMLTAYTDDEFVERAARIGVGGYLVKPIDEQRLLPALRVAEQQSQRLREAQAALSEQKLAEQAKAFLARRDDISEAEAWRQLQKMAMDKRVPLAAIARAVLEQDHERKTLLAAKQRLQKTGLSEKAAHKRLQALAAEQGVTVVQAAARLLRGDC